MSTNAHTRLAEGHLIGDRYSIGPVIGEGGMGVVYAARHVGLDVPVAFKVIRPDLKDDPEFVQRFLHEARAAASLQGEHIARVQDVGQLESGEPYLVMEHLEGIGLEAYINERGPLREYEAVKLVCEACAGLIEAHALRLVHRDIKPANLFLAYHADGSSILKILDFGISKHFSSGARGLTSPKKSLGSPWYMSPEQMTNPSEVDQRTDVWSLGVVLFELLTGAHPFDGRSIPEVCSQVLTAPTPSLRTWTPDAALELEAVVSWCLEKDPKDRCPSVMALSDALQPFAASPSSGRRLEVPSRGARNPILAFERTDPDPIVRSNGSRDRNGLGSLAPLAEHLKILPRRRWRKTTAVVGVAAGVSLAGLMSWVPASGQWLRAVEASGLELPWDPVLGTEPFDETSRGNYELPPWMARGALPEEAASSGVHQAEPGRKSERPEATLTPREIRRRTENYRDWLRRQGLRRLEDADAGVDGAPLTTTARQDEDSVHEPGQEFP